MDQIKTFYSHRFIDFIIIRFLTFLFFPHPNRSSAAGALPRTPLLSLIVLNSFIKLSQALQLTIDI